tara:strand:- start:385 stop:819 length:435 start_codon:yes stop_codon:yes gene_type:complete
MIYLYAGLGIAILTGITTLLQFSTNIIKNNGYLVFKQDEYVTSSSQYMDKKITKILYENTIDFGDKETICLNLKSKLEQSGYSEISQYKYIIGKDTPSTHNDLKNTCTITNGFHRVIIKRKDSKRYILYSCLLNKREFCTFELT